jgi:DNA repair protein RadA/Sms
LLAVLARRAGLNAGNLDVVATVSGGLRLRDPGADLAIACALASAIKDRPLAPGTAFIGEVALSGAVRPAQGAARRLQELSRIGIQRCLAAPGQATAPGVEVVEVRTIRDAVRLALGAD